MLFVFNCSVVSLMIVSAYVEFGSRDFRDGI